MNWTAFFYPSTLKNKALFKCNLKNRSKTGIHENVNNKYVSSR
jgi:hypothetical protein